MLRFSLIINQFRIPKGPYGEFWRVLHLSVAGLQMQTIFRNPLAGPYILGVSSGASLGVALLVLGTGGLLGGGITSADGFMGYCGGGVDWIGIGAFC